ncbi:hypothetical protein PG989_007172 [Apiospora arundinis]
MMVTFSRRHPLRVALVVVLLLTTGISIRQLGYTEAIHLSSVPIEILRHCPPTELDNPPRVLSPTIPNIIHQIWKNSDVSTYPAIASHESWRAMFSPLNYTVKLWTDDDLSSLITTKYAWLSSTYNNYRHNIQRADLARLVVIHAEGGIYADLDVHPRSVEEVACLQYLGLQTAFGPTSGTSGLSNHFFMGERGSDFLEWSLQEAKRRSGSANQILLPYLRVFWSTGPLMLTAAFRKYAWMYGTEQTRNSLLSEDYAGKVFGHAAGRSWHGADGYALNYFQDHVGGNGVWIVTAVLGSTLVTLFPT